MEQPLKKEKTVTKSLPIQTVKVTEAAAHTMSHQTSQEAGVSTKDGAVALDRCEAY